VREPVEWGEGDCVIWPAKALEVQVHDVAKGADPTGHVRVRSGGCWKMSNGETSGVMSGGV